MYFVDHGEGFHRLEKEHPGSASIEPRTGCLEEGRGGKDPTSFSRNLNFESVISRGAHLSKKNLPQNPDCMSVAL